MDNGLAIDLDGAREGHRSGSDSDKLRTSAARRSLPNSLLSRLNFLRPYGDASTQANLHDTATDDEQEASLPENMSDAMSRNVKTRKRTGSLRKTAILGTGRLKAEGRERRNSLYQHKSTSAPAVIEPEEETPIFSPRTSEEAGQSESDTSQTPQRRFSYDKEAEYTETESDQGVSGSPQHVSVEPVTSQAVLPPVNPAQSPPSASAASTTDEDDGLIFSRPVVTDRVETASSSSSSYFATSDNIVRRRSTKKPQSPLAVSPMDAYVPELEHSYSETEWWGWVMLVVTWLVFVVGMGSCLGVWSWAWDVGETPYAPPELEDDPTLPIIGYYPALIILTAVMSWIWVIVAWVGMKYFKHAKIQGDDT